MNENSNDFIKSLTPISSFDFFNTGNNPNFGSNIFDGIGGGGKSLFEPSKGGFLDFFNSKNLNNIGTGVDAVSSLFNIYQGMKTLDLGRDTFNLNRDALTTNLGNQANLTNERLNTRQASRLRSQGITGDANTQAVIEFMKKYGVSGQLGS